MMHENTPPASKGRVLAITGLCLGTWALFLRLVLSKV